MKKIEIWKPVVVWKNGKFYDYTGLYEVSNWGRVRSFDKIDSLGRLIKGRILKQSKTKGGYPFVNLYKNKQCQEFMIHRLVAMVFLPNPDNMPCVNHKDEDKTNNKVDNLEWCTYEYNSNYGTCIERMTNKLTNRKDRSKQILQFTMDGEFVAEYPSSKEIQRRFGFKTSNISKCCNNRCKCAYGYIWKHKNPV